MLTINQLDKSYGKNEVLKGISISFEPGTVAGIVGENGAGKTTLFRCIAGLEAYQGKVDYPTKLKDTLGLLQATPYFMTRITGKEYLQLCQNARKIPGGISEKENLFDLPLNQFAATYSTGMKKKLALTGTLLQNNEVFILDEPFSGVDIQSNALIVALIQRLKQAGKTVILSSHIFSTLENVCDTIHHLRDGKIIQSAGADEFTSIGNKLVGNEVLDRLDSWDF